MVAGIATGVASIVVQQELLLFFTIFARKDAKGHTTMHTVQLTEGTNQVQSDIDFITLGKR